MLTNFSLINGNNFNGNGVSYEVEQISRNVPDVSGLYVVRFTEKVRGYSYGYRFYNEKFRTNGKDSTIAYWGSIEEFSESRTTLHRPSDNTLVQGYLENTRVTKSPNNLVKNLKTKTSAIPKRKRFFSLDLVRVVR